MIKGIHRSIRRDKRSVGMNRSIRLVMAMTLTAATLVSVAGPAQAFDRGDCDRAFGASNIQSVDTIRIDTGTVGQVDFGDNLHLGGVPQGPAVVCWATNGRVALIGRLFVDSGLVVTRVSAKITYFYGNNVSGNYQPTFEIFSNNAGSTLVSEVASGRDYNRVRVRLYSPTNELVHTSNRYR